VSKVKAVSGKRTSIKCSSPASNPPDNLILSNCVLTYRCYPFDTDLKDEPDLTLTLSRLGLLDALRGKDTVLESQQGSIECLQTLLSLAAIESGSVRGPSQL